MSFVVSTRFQLALMALAFVLLSFAMAPNRAHAAALTLTAATTTSNNASTTLAKVGNTVTYGIQLSGTPWEAPKINVFNMGTTSFTGSGSYYTYSTTSVSAWTEGPISFMISYGGTTVGDATTTKSQADLTGSNVRFDKTAPTGYTVDVATYVNASTVSAAQFSFAGAEVGASYFYAIGNGTASTSGSGTITTATQAVTGINLSSLTNGTLTLNASLTDAAGNVGATTTDTGTLDATAPSAPTPDVTSGSTFASSVDVTLTSSGSNSIRYTTDGTTATCSTGTAVSGAITISENTTISAIGCDTAGNSSAVSSMFYVKAGSQGSRRNGGSGGGGSSRTTTPAALTTPAAQNNNAPSTSNSVFTRDLQVGMMGEDVKALQVWLNAHGFPVAVSGAGSAGMETTLFGALTKAAVMKFQAANNISAIGRMGPMTRAAISSM